MNEEQLLQEARKEAEKVYPIPDEEESYYTTLRRDNALRREGYITCYIANAKKQNLELVRFLDSIRAYEHESGKAICYDERESIEFVQIFKQQQKQ